jgi:uncharacterized membrane protein YcaP (DUF421 family)
MDTFWSLLTVAGRVVLVYLFLLVMVRLMGRGTLAQLRPIDVLTMLLISETVSPALTGGDDSLAAGITAACALGLSAVITGKLSYRFRWFDQLLDGSTLVLIDHGKIRQDVMRSQQISDEELKTALHHHGVLSVEEVHKGFIEPDGSITLVKAESVQPK